jgi:apolipoprotein N-acyltransferase
MQAALTHEESHTPDTTKLPRQAIHPSHADSRPWLWLLIAAALLPFSGGADTIALAAWLAPVFLLRFTRTRALKIWLPTAYVLLVAAGAFQSRGIPISGVALYIFLIISAFQRLRRM